VQSVRNIVEAASEIGIQYLTLYAFSTENWDRPAAEVTGLMSLFVDTLSKEVPSLHKNNIRLHFIGNLALLPDDAKVALEQATLTTSKNTGLELIIALSYSSRWELIQAIKNIAEKVQLGALTLADIKEATLEAALSTSAFPDPELMIRTSGEYRISNFLLYQLAYAELYFTETRWPDFGKKDLIEALLDFQCRERRFGKTSVQIQTND